MGTGNVPIGIIMFILKIVVYVQCSVTFGISVVSTPTGDRAGIRLVVKVGGISQSQNVVTPGGSIDGKLRVSIAETAAGTDKFSAINGVSAGYGFDHKTVRDTGGGVGI
ncbi:MAG: hypothetical protein UT14_C0015G0011 [Candidatus Shapirobacteria bacterium GW2011_GWE1_38_92]|uniref:Uncharacterized protein n=1 Tax=Candidatus Shapirobacteria bacterium GW2011_GWE1_38_92 TaxID=1618489 RepID=A0A0G0LTL7_9BACT|nr:MAG: hypothetical protein UT14_C0015G0011 [Candidatus Shapirobacteria bacterium GW2011_GWE1_38_92]